MCGRYSVSVDAEELWKELDLEGDPTDLHPRYNVAPTQDVPAVLDREPKRLVLVRWGLVPFWAKDPSIGNRMINARAETVADKPAFRRAFERRRCLIPADGFYEWKRVGKRKVPMWIHLRSRRPFTFAGLWDVWHGPDDERLLSCTIVTTEPGESIADIHDRMPAILPADARAVWLDRDASPEDLRALLRPYDDAELEYWEVSTLVNDPGNDDPECIRPAGQVELKLGLPS